MKKKFLDYTTSIKYDALLFLLFLLTLPISCKKDDESEKIGNWITSTVFDGSPRSSAISFTVGNFAYVGTGYDGDDYLKDFWQYDFEGEFWVQKADFPGQPRSSSVAFVIGTNGYLGTGYNGTDELKDFYKYDPTLNSWSAIADFGGTPRRGAVGFNSTTHGYVGSGFDGDNDKKDFWKYDPISNTWEEKFGFGGGKRREGATFTIGDKVYFGTGSSNGIDLDDFWVFNTTNEVWTRLRDLDDNEDYRVKRSNATCFSIGNNGYVTAGTSSSTSIWEYNPANDGWEEKHAFEGVGRQDAVSIQNSQKAYILLGKNGNFYFDDMFEFKPFDEYNDED